MFYFINSIVFWYLELTAQYLKSFTLLSVTYTHDYLSLHVKDKCHSEVIKMN